MKKTWVLILIVIGLMAVAGAVLILSESFRPRLDLRVGSSVVSVEVAAMPFRLARGLSGRPSLLPGQGMLFVIEPPGRPAFWMKDMKFSLDLVYLRDGRVVEIRENVPPPSAGTAPEPFAPAEVCDRVLEVNAGWVKANAIKVGDRADY